MKELNKKIVTVVKRNIVLLATSFITNIAFAQPPSFSQYFISPMTVNPALLGKNIADWRGIANYRNQWFGNATSQPYTTSSISIEKRITNKKPAGDYFAMGLHFLTDASNNGLLKNNYFSGSLAYHNPLDKEGNLILSGGLSVSYHNRILDPTKFTFQSQFGSGGYQPGIGLSDGVNISKNSYVAVNAGVQLSDRKKMWGYNLGIGIYNANRARDAAYNQGEIALSPRISIQGGLQFYAKNGSEWDVALITNHQSAPNDLVTFGGQYKIHIPGELISLRSLNIGLWNHFGESFTTYVGIESKSNWLIGISYDFVNSDIVTGANSLQTMEFSFAWQFAGKSKKELLAKQKTVVLY